MAADPTRNQTVWSMVAHAGGAVVTFVAPLAVLLVRGGASPYVRSQAVEALNFQITVVIAYAVALLLSYLFIGFILLPVIFIANIVLSVSAAMAVGHGQSYAYPAALRLVK